MGQHGFDTMAHAQTDSLGGSTRPVAESDVCDHKCKNAFVMVLLLSRLYVFNVF